jgi:hypothetical protein
MLPNPIIRVIRPAAAGVVVAVAVGVAVAVAVAVGAVPVFWIRLFAEKTGDRTVRGAFQFLLRNFLLQRILKRLL